MKKLILYLLLLTMFSCTHDPAEKKSCYQLKLLKIKEVVNYKQLVAAFKEQIAKLKNSAGLPIYLPEYVRSTQIDSLVFFDPAYKKCVVMLLQQTQADLNLDQVQFIQGDLTKAGWVFKLDRMPAVPDITLTVDKVKKDGHPINNSFERLSDKGAEFVLSAGNILYSGCDIDHKYWFDN